MEREANQEYKGYGIERSTAFLTYKLKGIGKGALPKELQGSYTSIRFLKESVDRYLDRKTTV